MSFQKETERIHSTNIETTAEFCTYTDCYYQLAPDDVKAIEMARDLLKTCKNITALTMIYEGEVTLLDAEGFDCRIEYTRLLVFDTECYLHIQEKNGDLFEIITNY